uniref:Neuropeptide W n=1 Tax=Jaculus jaculus TaxID=51337 RepID=A0A8C5K4X1_JACJA
MARSWGSRGRGPGARARWPLLAMLLLLALPAGAWYKHVASPRYRAVGRAAGLLVGLRRSPYLWRRALRPSAGPLAWHNPAPGPAARSALGLPSTVPEPWGPLPARAPRRTCEYPQWLSQGSWISVFSSAFGEMPPALLWFRQQTAFAELVRLHECPENILRPSA